MRNFGKIILGTFTAALRRNTDQPRPTVAQSQEFNKAIHCVRSITDFYLMTQYRSHTSETVSYMQEYLRSFHETKDVFLRFRAGKKAKKAAAMAHLVLLVEQTQTSVQGLAVSEKAKVWEANALERQELVETILKDGSYFNFPKLHLLTHYAEQIPRFGALTQYSTDITESMYREFKDAYRRSNKVESMDQILTTYTRYHTFIMKDLEIHTWNSVRQ